MILSNTTTTFHKRHQHLLDDLVMTSLYHSLPDDPTPSECCQQIQVEGKSDNVTDALGFTGPLEFNIDSDLTHGHASYTSVDGKKTIAISSKFNGTEGTEMWLIEKAENR